MRRDSDILSGSARRCRLGPPPQARFSPLRSAFFSSLLSGSPASPRRADPFRPPSAPLKLFVVFSLRPAPLLRHCFCFILQWKCSSLATAPSSAAGRSDRCGRLIVTLRVLRLRASGGAPPSRSSAPAAPPALRLRPLQVPVHLPHRPPLHGRRRGCDRPLHASQETFAPEVSFSCGRQK